jgi:predicted AlkP superfamily pyrophosphatase or phosphodiesterase
MRRVLTILFGLILLLGPLLLADPQQAPSAQFPGPIEHVLIVSVDGLMPASYTQPDAHGLKVPTMRMLVREGAYSGGVYPVFPTVTYPTHTSLVTGVNPGTHGVFTNTAFDPLDKNEHGWRWYAEDIRVPTLWDVARARGLNTALIGWPVTVGTQADLLVPEFWRAGTPEDLKLLRALSTRGLLETVASESLDFYARLQPPNTKDSALTDIAIHAIETGKPNLLLLHLIQVDHEEHDYGPFSAEADAVIENADAQIARLIEAAKRAGIWERTALVVVSDHGFAPISRSVRPGIWLRKKHLIELGPRDKITAWKAAVLPASACAYIYVKDKNDTETQRMLLQIFQPLAGKRDSGIRRVITQERIAAMGGDPGAFLALEAADGFSVVGGYTGKTVEPSTQKGTHGYFPDRPEMECSLLIFGPAVGNAKIPNARVIDIAPTVARWLGLSLDKAEGKALDVPIHAAPH